MKIYTRTGDKGQTSLFGGRRVSKSDARVATYGTLDELNSALGMVLAHLRPQKLKRAGKPLLARERDWLVDVQRDLFALGSWLASPEASERVAKGEEAFPGARSKRTQIDSKRITDMEKMIDAWEKDLPAMKSFILPGGGLAGAKTHFARTVCRRAEREIVALSERGEVVPEIAVQYVNRLADALFVLARFLNKKQKIKEDPWL